MSSFLRASFIGLGIAVVCGIGFGFWLNSLTSIHNKIEVKINNQYIVADAVRTPEARAKGLSGKESLGINEGMMFFFEVPGRYGFWMKDMKFPIDIVWIKNHKVVGVEMNVGPQIGVSEKDLKIYFPPEEVDQVLELASGRTQLLRVMPGDSVLTRPLLKY